MSGEIMMTREELVDEIDAIAEFALSMNHVANIINQVNEINGWNVERSAAEWAILAVTEIAEAFEEYRNPAVETLIYTVNGKPEGQAVEYADVLIRVLHWFAQHNIDPNEVVEMKLKYNLTRGYRHGGKKA